MKKASASGSNEQRRAVLLVGSGYGALKVAQDIAQSGLPLDDYGHRKFHRECSQEETQQ